MNADFPRAGGRVDRSATAGGRDVPASLDSRVAGTTDHEPRTTDQAAFTLIEMLVVIGIIALLAGLIVGATHLTGSKMKENSIRAELHALVAAIEAYHDRFNSYPPDHVVSRNPLVVNSATNSLYYELTGVLVEDRSGTFRSPNRTEKIPSGAGSVLDRYFGVDAILNSDPDPKKIKNFLPNWKTSQSKAINSLASDRPQPELLVLVVPAPWPPNLIPQPTRIPGLNPWHYVSTQPTNNPSSYDLWAEYMDGKELKIIGNWGK